MTAARLPDPGKLPNPSEMVAQILRDLIHERTGIYFDDSRLDTMLDKLGARVAAAGCTAYLDYYYLLKYDEKAQGEWRNVLEAFSVQETYFWREADQIEALVGTFVPAWFAQNRGPLRIWSAACATGEEPYSLAMALEEAGWGRHPIEIMASDASENALARARAGAYRERSFRTLPERLRQKYFTRDGEQDILRPEIRSRVDFRWANLMALGPEDGLKGFPVIFCRNVFIYFSLQAIGRVAAEFAQRMPAGGHLFIGASESLLKIAPDFDLREIKGAFVYVRKTAP